MPEEKKKTRVKVEKTFLWNPSIKAFTDVFRKLTQLSVNYPRCPKLSLLTLEVHVPMKSMMSPSQTKEGLGALGGGEEVVG